MTGDTVRKKIIGVSVVVALLAMLCAQSVTADVPDDITFDAWTDKPQYNPGDSGVLTISILNEQSGPVEITRIYIEYPWFVYDASEDTWLGNATFEGTPLAILTSKGGDYYKEVDFTIPTDGRVLMDDYIIIVIDTSVGDITPPETLVPLNVASISLPMEIVDLDLWMTSLIVAVVICTVILAIAVFLSRRAPAPRFVAPPPPKPKAKAA